MSTSELKEKPIDWFKPDAGNVKLHSEQQIEQLMASIKRFGFRDPIGVLADGRVLEGHGRLEAAKRLKFAKVPALILTGLTDEEARGYAIAHNQTTLNTGLDSTAVREEFERLNVGESDYLSLGYTTDDVLFTLSDLGGGAGGTDHNGHATENLNALLSKVCVSELPFISQSHYERFSNFLVMLRLRYPDRSTIAERMSAFVQEYGNGL